MKIKSVRIKNFRAFEDEVFTLEPYTCLIGANGAGKSTLLCALNIFFRDASNATPVDVLTAEDFHKKNTQERAEITIAFDDLSAEAKIELKDYVRNDEIIVSAVAEFEEEKGKAIVKQVGSRLGIAEFAPFFAAHKANASAEALNAIFAQLKESFPGLGDGRSKDAKRDALHAFEADPANSALLIAIESEDQFYGFAGSSKLKTYVQWVYVPAVKDASDEQAESRDGALGKLLARTVRARVNFKERLSCIEIEAQEQYSGLLADNQTVLDEVAASLSRRLSEWSHPDVDLKLQWAATPITIREPSAKVVAGEFGFEGDLARFGHGFQRSYLLALLQELAAIDGADGPTLVLGVEEPELYQHPPQARYLAQTLQALSNNAAQVLLTTHSPYFVTGGSFEKIRLVRKLQEDGASTVSFLTFDRYAERCAVDGKLPRPPTAIEVLLNEGLRPNLNEMFFATRLVLVEGTEDAAYLLSWAALTGRMNAFRSKGIHVVSVEGKQNLASPTIIAQELGIPVLTVFDGDRSQENDPAQIKITTHLFRVLDANEQGLFPTETRWGKGFIQWPENIGETVRSELIDTLGADLLEVLRQRAMASCGHAPKLDKNTMYIQSLMQLAHAAGGRSVSLDRLCEAAIAI